MAKAKQATKQQAAVDLALKKATKRAWNREEESVLGSGKKATKEFYEIPAKWIEVDKNQVRQSGVDRKDISLQELASDIAENGLMHPVVVEEIGKDKYRVLYGERRFVAMSKVLKWDTILCRITTIEEHQRRFSQLSENLHREDLGAFDIAAAVEELMREHEMSLAELAAKLHKSEPWVQRAITVSKKLTPEAKKLLVGSDAAGSMAAVYYVATVPEENQVEIAKAVAEGGLSQRDIIAMTSEAKKATPTTGRGRRASDKPKSFEKRISIDGGTVTLKLADSDATKQQQIAALTEAISQLAEDTAA